MGLRNVLATLGAAVAAAGVLVAVRPGTASLGVDRVAIEVVGVVALAKGVLVAKALVTHDVTQARVSEPETPLTTDVPGDDFDDDVASLRQRASVYRNTPRIADRLRTAATDALVRYGGYSTEEATDRVEDGRWTADPDANAFLTGRVAAPTSMFDAVRRRLRGTSVPHRIRSTVDAVAAAAGVDADAPSDLPDGTGSRAERGRSGSGPALPADAAVDADAADLVRLESRETDRWHGLKAVAFVGVGAGVLAGQPGLVLAGVAGVGFAGYVESVTPSEVSVSVDRTVDDDRPDPGDEVAVTVTVTNDGERLLPDVRLVDGVPGSLAVADGSPRLGVALRPGKSARLTYTVTARRGEHEFDAVGFVVRDATGALEREYAAPVETELVCRPSMTASAPVPLRTRGAGYAGRLPTEVGGSGVEFHSVREYHHGDPTNRLDWRQYARTGKLATKEFHEERLTKVVIVVDARAPAYRAPDGSGAHAVGRSTTAAARMATALLDAGHRVGLAVVSPDPEWLAPGAGDDHRERIRRLLARSPPPDPARIDGEVYSPRWPHRIRRRLDTDTQVVVASALCDGLAALLVRWLESYGHPATVLSPDPTVADTVGHRLAHVERRLRAADLRARGISVIDWAWDEPLDAALDAARTRQ